MFFNNLFNNSSPFSNYSNYLYRNRPKQETFYRNDTRTIIINKLLNDDNNYFCFDCHKKTNIIKYYDIKNAIFLCYNCALNHNHLSNDIAEVMTGDIRILEEKYLLLLYYGGNKNLNDFIRIYFPLLERMDKNNMYATKAMDYYRKLIRAKAYNEQEPCMPRKLEGYNSIFRNKINQGIDYSNNNRRNNHSEMMDIDNDNNDLYKSSIFGNTSYRKNININKNKNVRLENEPAVINNKNENIENEDIEMKDDCSKKSDDSTYDDTERINDKENQNQNQNENININETNKKEYKIKNKINERQNNLTINQLGELSMYPDAKIIDEMD